MRLRPARPDDAPAIAEIYNAGILEGGAAFESVPRTVADIEQRIQTRDRFPIVVAETGHGRVVGWAGVSRYRDRAAYAGIGEFSVYVAPDARGQQTGRRLLEALVGAARDAGFWKLVSRVFPFNLASRAACRAVGFREAGVYEKHGFHAGRWHDVVIVERLIPENSSPSRTEVPSSDWRRLARGIQPLLLDAKLPLDGAEACLPNFVLAVRGDTVVGCAALEGSTDAMLLRSVALAPAERGSGAGRLLVERTLHLARRTGARDIVLLTTTAEKFFSHLGFARITRADVPAALLDSPELCGACPDAAVIMSMTLSKT